MLSTCRHIEPVTTSRHCFILRGHKFVGTCGFCIDSHDVGPCCCNARLRWASISPGAAWWWVRTHRPTFCVEFACSPSACVGFLLVLLLQVRLIGDCCAYVAVNLSLYMLWLTGDLSRVVPFLIKVSLFSFLYLLFIFLWGRFHVLGVSDAGPRAEMMFYYINKQPKSSVELPLKWNILYFISGTKMIIVLRWLRPSELVLGISNIFYILLFCFLTEKESLV